ncbi:transporter [Flavobacterium sp. AS60]|uniref:transporter n=1 Tax=Flavobacterium anseongense TaxID=2910677 RepID=UPI001F17E88D|nr:transporter [Flavobacterium sp. AS60]MCF6129686.1 transporter [Flavobacterium sp. AS60]
MKNKLLLLCVFGFTTIQAQTEPIQADRPDQTETPAIVPRGMFQVETGFTFQKNDESSNSNSLPTVLWKYGVNENFELRLITEFVSEKNFDEKTNGFTPVLIGFKVKLCEEKGIVPKTSFIGHLGLPNVASSKYKNDFVAPEFRFTMQHTLSEKFSLSYNLGCEWDGMTPETTFIYTLTTGYSINKKLGFYAELFGFAPEKNKADHSFDGGFTYLINNNFMVDLSSGVGITENAPDYYLALGCSFRI